MMIGKTLFVLFLLASFSFAAWEGVAALAIVTSLTLIALVFAIGYGFGIEILKVTAKDEIYQLIALAILIVVLFAGNNILDTISTDPTLSGSQANMQTTALLSLNNTLENLSSAYSDVQNVDKDIGIAAAQVLSCQLQGMGYSVSGCGGFSMLASPFSLAGSIMGFALGELSAIYKLIDLSLSYGLTLLLPLGIILRTFRITRGAGGFLIAAGISFHILLPIGILFVDMLGDSFLADPNTPSEYKSTAGLSGINPVCDPGDTGEGNSNAAYSAYSSLRNAMKSYIFLILVKATLGPVVSILMMVAGIRYLTSLAGAEVDVSALARVI
jgi:hypothetical protein